MAGTPTSGVISSSYVSNRKPMLAIARTSHWRKGRDQGDLGINEGPRNAPLIRKREKRAMSTREFGAHGSVERCAIARTRGLSGATTFHNAKSRVLASRPARLIPKPSGDGASRAQSIGSGSYAFWR